MTPLNFAIVGLRLMGIYFIVASVPLFASTGLTMAFLTQMAMDSKSVQTVAIIASLIPPVGQLVLGILVFTLSPMLAIRLIPFSDVDSNKTQCSREAIEAVAFATVGILIVATALPDLGRVLQNFYYWYVSQYSPTASSYPNGKFSSLYAVGVTAQIVVGLLLVLSPQGFRNIWHWLRTAGTRPRE